jgi:hypothetical protein
MPACIRWGEERHEECSRTEDQGYDECSRSEDEGHRACCDWAPCSWFCDAWVWISHVVCVAWTWVSNVVCVAWTWVTTAICVLWDTITTLVNAILVTLESILGCALSAIAFLIELVEMIPLVGTLVRWILNAATSLVWLVGGLLDTLLGVLGIRPEKILRICTVILSDEKGNPVGSIENAVAMLQLAANVYKRDANIRLVPLRPFHYATGHASAITVDETWVQTDAARSESNLLDAPCNAGGEWLVAGSLLQSKSSVLCLYGAWRRVLGYGAPITCFLVRSMPGALGCSLVITDYVSVIGNFNLPPDSPRTIGHEVGHSSLLWHTCVDDGIRNIMATGEPCDPDSLTAPDRADPELEDWQALLVRTSKHATYF